MPVLQQVELTAEQQLDSDPVLLLCLMLGSFIAELHAASIVGFKSWKTHSADLWLRYALLVPTDAGGLKQTLWP